MGMKAFMKANIIKAAPGNPTQPLVSKYKQKELS